MAVQDASVSMIYSLTPQPGFSPGEVVYKRRKWAKQLSSHNWFSLRHTVSSSARRIESDRLYRLQKAGTASSRLEEETTWIPSCTRCESVCWCVCGWRKNSLRVLKCPVIRAPRPITVCTKDIGETAEFLTTYCTSQVYTNIRSAGRCYI